jgi:hypothetical protein
LVHSTESKQMGNFRGQAMAAAIGVIVLGGVGMGAAAAADMVPEAELQAPSPEYYPNPSRYYSEPRVDQRPPVVYGYAPPPAYYAYGPRPGVVVVPEAYYPRRHYGPVYGGRPYYAPHIARGYGRYDRRWDRGHHRW